MCGWMFHRRNLNNKIDFLHDWALRIQLSRNNFTCYSKTESDAEVSRNKNNTWTQFPRLGDFCLLGKNGQLITIYVGAAIIPNNDRKSTGNNFIHLLKQKCEIKDWCNLIKQFQIWFPSHYIQCRML